MVLSGQGMPTGGSREPARFTAVPSGSAPVAGRRAFSRRHLLALAGTAALGGVLSQGVGGWRNAGSMADVRVSDLTEVPGYLANPGMGYQGWTRQDGRLASVCEYRRFEWRQLNPRDGEYDWAPLDRLLADAESRGEQASFRVMTMLGEDYGGHLVPRWVLDRGAVIRRSGEPDYRNRYYLTHFGRFVDALRDRYDGDPRIAFIDIAGYGQFNEWQADDLTDDGGAEDLAVATTADAGARRMLIHMHVGGADTTAATTADGSVGNLDYDFAGFRSTQLVMPYGGMWAPTRYVLDRYPDVGWRNDALLGPDATYEVFTRIGHGVEQRWKTAPVMFEPLNGRTEDDFGAGTRTLRGMGACIVHDNSLRADADALGAWLERVGYRYVCRRVLSPRSVAAGGRLSIESAWLNTGYSRAYPRMGQDFTVAFGLAASDGAVVGSWTSGDDVSTWLPGEERTAAVDVTLPGLPTGTYTRLVGIHNRTSGARIQLPLATDLDDRWYPAGTIEVT